VRPASERETEVGANLQRGTREISAVVEEVWNVRPAVHLLFLLLDWLLLFL
jgi:hypothetical protein